MLRTFLIICVFIIVGLGGCATGDKELMYIGTGANSILLQNKGVAKKMLLAQYEEWKGVKYKYGGLSKDGIDCSGFIYETFLTKFEIKLPRKSIVQGKVGINISVSSLQAGDLLFFKTRISTTHIGIYIENSDFIHVSESLGVAKSSLNDPYWHKRFWKARRITM
jgi:cell wall-associated NlpC family hydrolase